MNAWSLPALALDLLFPRRCPWCDDVQGFLTEPCPCQKDVDALQLTSPVAVPVAQNGQHIAAVHACFEYEGPVRRAILRMKFGEEPELAAAFGKEMAALVADRGLVPQHDLVVAVPISAKTLRRRGYNQSLLLAETIAEGHLPCEKDALCKVRETRPQRELTREERLENVQDAFVADAARVAAKRVLLVDDIFTTGSTAGECARVLVKAGAAMCTVVCMAAARPEEAGDDPDGL